jgi:hypothetical protein
MGVEQEHFGSILEWLQNSYKMIMLKDLRNEKTSQEVDTDLSMQHPDLGSLTVEVKVRKKYYPDLAIETFSCLERKTQGYIDKSQAQFLAYVYLENAKVHSESFVVSLPNLKRWFYLNKNKYTPKLAPNPPENPLYHTQFYPVPLQDIPISFFMPKVAVSGGYYTVNHGKELKE